jgi:hypothetical protein
MFIYISPIPPILRGLINVALRLGVHSTNVLPYSAIPKNNLKHAIASGNHLYP